MNDVKDLNLFFILGLLIESFLLLGPKLFKNIKDLFLSFLYSLIALYPNGRESFFGPDYQLVKHWYVFWLFFAGIFSFLFREIVLPVITELSTMISVLILIYIYFSSNFQLPILTAILIISAIANFLLLLLKDTLAPVSKLLIYIWYLAITIWLSIYFLTPVVFHFSSVNKLNPEQQIILGMSSMILFTRLFAIFYLLPGKGYGTQEIYEQALVLVSKFSDKQNRVVYNIVVVLGLLIIFFLHHFYFQVPLPILIGFILIASQLVEKKIVHKQ